MTCPLPASVCGTKIGILIVRTLVILLKCTSSTPPGPVLEGTIVAVPPVMAIGPPVYWTLSGSVKVKSRLVIGAPAAAGAVSG